MHDLCSELQTQDTRQTDWTASGLTSSGLTALPGASRNRRPMGRHDEGETTDSTTCGHEAHYPQSVQIS